MEPKTPKNDKPTAMRPDTSNQNIGQTGSSSPIASIPIEKCRICDGELIPIWRNVQIRDRFTSRYKRCVKCWSVQLTGLEWLRDAYWGDTSIRYDEGRLQRNKVVYSFINHIRQTISKDKMRLLDYGSGQEAILKRLSNEHGKFEVENYDPYVKEYGTIPTGKFDIITCIEVLEHLADVSCFYDHIKDLLDQNGIVVCSTEIHIPFGPRAHNLNWRYMTRNIGQHITFWTRQSLVHFAHMINAQKYAMVAFPNKMDLRFYVFCNGESTEFLTNTTSRVISL